MNPTEKYINILVAEDDEDDIEMFKEALEKQLLPTIVHAVTNGMDLLNYLEENPKPDLVFLDLNMPLKSGKECLEKLWQTQYVNSVPIVVCSTSNHPNDIDVCYKMGARYYLVKPNAFNSLVRLLNQLFSSLDGDHTTKPPKAAFVLSEA